MTVQTCDSLSLCVQVIEEGPEPRPRLEGKKRVYRVWLDTNQYQSDMGRLVEGAEDVYESFNVFVRRKPKENNFKVPDFSFNVYMLLF